MMLVTCMLHIYLCIYLSISISVYHLVIYLSIFCLSYAPDVKSRLIRKDPDARKD